MKGREDPEHDRSLASLDVRGARAADPCAAPAPVAELSATERKDENPGEQRDHQGDDDDQGIHAGDLTARSLPRVEPALLRSQRDERIDAE